MQGNFWRRTGSMVGFFAAVMTARPALAQMTEWPMVFPDARFYLGIDVTRLRGHLDMEDRQLLSDMEATIEAAIRLKASEATRIGMQFGSSQFDADRFPGSVGGCLGVVFEFENAIPESSRDFVMELANAERRQHGESVYFASPHEPCFLFEENDLLLCEEERLQEFLDSRARNDPGELEAIAGDLDVQVHARFDESGSGKFLLQVFDSLFPAHAEKGPFRDNLAALVENASSLSLSIDLSSDEVLMLELQLREGGDPERLEQGGASLVIALQELFRTMREEMEPHLPDGSESRELANETVQWIDRLLADAKVSRSGDSVKVSCHHEGGSQELASLLVRAASAIVRDANQ